MRTLLAALDMTAERRRAAALDRRHHLELAEAHMAGIGQARQAGPWSRKMSATSSLGTRTAAGLRRPRSSASQQASSAEQSSGLVTSPIVLVATRV